MKVGNVKPAAIREKSNAGLKSPFLEERATLWPPPLFLFQVRIEESDKSWRRQMEGEQKKLLVEQELSVKGPTFCLKLPTAGGI